MKILGHKRTSKSKNVSFYTVDGDVLQLVGPCIKLVHPDKAESEAIEQQYVTSEVFTPCINLPWKSVNWHNGVARITLEKETHKEAYAFVSDFTVKFCILKCKGKENMCFYIIMRNLNPFNDSIELFLSKIK